MAVGKDLDGLVRRAMCQQLGAPIEKISLAGVQLGGTLKLTGGLQRISLFFRCIGS